jgi:hypothetical protein
VFKQISLLTVTNGSFIRKIKNTIDEYERRYKFNLILTVCCEEGHKTSNNVLFFTPYSYIISVSMHGLISLVRCHEGYLTSKIKSMASIDATNVNDDCSVSAFAR